MSIAIIASAQAGSTDGITATTAALDTTGANLLVVAVANYNNASATVTDSKNNTWTPRTQYQAGGQYVRLFECVGTPTVGTGHTFSASAGSASISPRISVVAASGAAASPFQAEQGNASTGITSIAPGAGPLTPTLNGALIVAGLNDGGGEAATVDSGFTAVTGAYAATLAVGGGLAYLEQATAAGVNPSFSWTTSAAAAVAMAIYLPAAGGGGANATGYGLAASPSSVATGSPVTVTASLLGGTVLATTLDITLADSLGSTISGHILIPNGSTSGTATVTPSVTGTHNITGTHTGGGFTGGDGPTTFTATVPGAAIPVTNLNLVFSPGNWYSDGGGAFGSNNIRASSTYALSNTPGAYLDIALTSTGSGTVTLNLDPTILNGVPSGGCPVLSWLVDGTTPYGTDQLAYSASPLALALASGLASGAHTVRVFFRAVDLSSSSAMGDRYNDPATGFSGVKVTGVTVDSGSTLTAPAVLPLRAIVFSDSTGEGAQNVNGNLTPDGQDAAVAYPLLLGPVLNAEIGNVGFSTSGYSQAGYGNVPALYNADVSVSAWSKYFAGASRLGQPVDYVACFHGINGSVTSGTVAAWMAQVRAALPSVKILVGVPWNRANWSNVVAGYNTYQAATPDANAFLVDGGTNYSSFNNGFPGHPSIRGDALAAEAYGRAIAASGATGTATGGGGGTDPWATALPGSYAAGTAGAILGALANPLHGYPLAQGGTSTTITLAATTGTDIVDQDVVILGGTGVDQWRRITQIDPVTRVATVDPPWTTVPDTTSVYALATPGSGSAWLTTVGAVEPGETGVQTLRLMRSRDLGPWDITTNPGFVTYFRKDGTTESFRLPLPGPTGRAEPTLGGGL